MTTYRRRPQEVEAIQWTGDNLDEVREWLGEGWYSHVIPRRELCVHVRPWTGTGGRTFRITDYLVRDRSGTVVDKVYRVSAEEFGRDYEAVGCSSPYHCDCGCGAHMGCFINDVSPSGSPRGRG